MNLLIVETPAEVGAWRSVLSKAKGNWKVASIGHDCMSIPTLDDSTVVLLRDCREYRDLNQVLAGKAIDRIHIATQDDERGEALAVVIRDWLNKHWQGLKQLRGQKAGILTRVMVKTVGEKALSRAVRSPAGFKDGVLYSYIYRTIMDQCTERRISDAMENRVRLPLSLNRMQAVALSALVTREAAVVSGHKVTNWALYTKFKNGITTVSESCPYEGMADRYGSIIRGTISRSLSRKTVDVPAPLVLNTTSLIVEASKRWGLNSLQVMSAARSLYAEGEITSPMTQGRGIDPELQKTVGGYLRKARMVYKKRPEAGYLGIQVVDVHKEPRKGLGRPRKGIKKPVDHVYALIWEYTVASQMKPAKVEFHRVIVHRPHSKNRVLGMASGGRVVDPGFTEVLTRILTPIVPGGWEVASTSVEDRVSDPLPRWTEGDLISHLSEQGIDSPSLYLPVLEHLWSAKYIRVGADGTISPTVRGEFMVNILKRAAPFLMDPKFSDYVESSLADIADGKPGDVWLTGFISKVLDKAVLSIGSVQIVSKAPFCRRTQDPYRFMIHPEGDPYFANDYGDVAGVEFDSEGMATGCGSRPLPGKCNTCKEKTLITTRWWHGDKSSCTSCGADN